MLVLRFGSGSLQLLASLIAFGAERGTAYEALPKWRNGRTPRSELRSD